MFPMNDIFYIVESVINSRKCFSLPEEVNLIEAWKIKTQVVGWIMNSTNTFFYLYLEM